MINFNAELVKENIDIEKSLEVKGETKLPVYIFEHRYTLYLFDVRIDIGIEKRLGKKDVVEIEDIDCSASLYYSPKEGEDEHPVNYGDYTLEEWLCLIVKKQLYSKNPSKEDLKKLGRFLENIVIGNKDIFLRNVMHNYKIYAKEFNYGGHDDGEHYVNLFKDPKRKVR